MNYNKLPRGEEEKYIKLLAQAQPQIIEDPLLNFNYEPPIQLLVRDVVTKMQEQQEDKVMEVVHYYNINVDKEELIKALAYDRDQYRKGYTDALKERQGEWIKKHRHRGGFRTVTVTDSFGEKHTGTVDNRYEYDELYCSVCGKIAHDAFLNYCANCGAKMKGAE